MQPVISNAENVGAIEIVEIVVYLMERTSSSNLKKKKIGHCPEGVLLQPSDQINYYPVNIISCGLN